MVFDPDDQSLLCGIHRGNLRHRPAFEDPLGLQAEIVMESTGVVLLHDKDWPVPLSRVRRSRRGLGFGV